jgi:hypothetical protein
LNFTTLGRNTAIHNSILLEDIFWLTECAEHPIHTDGVVTIVVAISSVVNGMIARTHNGPNLAMNTIMNVCCPDGLYE